MNILSGDKTKFAIQSHINTFYENQSRLALGNFQIVVLGKAYGQSDKRASLLACSFNNVRKFIQDRGNHVTDFSNEKDATLLANCYRHVLYGDDETFSINYPITKQNFKDQLLEGNIIFAPDGDEVFDDGSHILIFDIEEKVRVIAFKSTKGILIDNGSLKDIYVDCNLFYSTLDIWSEKFKSEWKKIVINKSVI